MLYLCFIYVLSMFYHHVLSLVICCFFSMICFDLGQTQASSSGTGEHCARLFGGRASALQHLLACHHCTTHRFCASTLNAWEIHFCRMIPNDIEGIGNCDSDLLLCSVILWIWLGWFAVQMPVLFHLDLKWRDYDLEWGIPIEVAFWGKVSTLLLCCCRLVFVRIYCNSFLRALWTLRHNLIQFWWKQVGLWPYHTGVGSVQATVMYFCAAVQ